MQKSIFSNGSLKRLHGKAELFFQPALLRDHTGKYIFVDGPSEGPPRSVISCFPLNNSIFFNSSLSLSHLLFSTYSSLLPLLSLFSLRHGTVDSNWSAAMADWPSHARRWWRGATAARVALPQLDPATSAVPCPDPCESGTGGRRSIGAVTGGARRRGKHGGGGRATGGRAPLWSGYSSERSPEVVGVALPPAKSGGNSHPLLGSTQIWCWWQVEHGSGDGRSTIAGEAWQQWMRDRRTGAARIRWQQLEEPGGSGWVCDGERFASFFQFLFSDFYFSCGSH